MKSGIILQFVKATVKPKKVRLEGSRGKKWYTLPISETGLPQKIRQVGKN
jgi:hypothetical protein